MAGVVGKAIAATLLVGGACFAAYPYLWTTEEVRYRIDASIATPDGVRSGSGVWGIRLRPRWVTTSFLVGSGWSYEHLIRGDAIPIDVGNQRVVYLLLGGRRLDDRNNFLDPTFSFNDRWSWSAPNGQLSDAGYGTFDYDRDAHILARNQIAWVKRHRGIALNLDCLNEYRRRDDLSKCPAFARVDNSASMPNVRLLDPAALEAEFGKNHRFGHLRMTVVDVPITRGIDKRLPWATAPTRKVRDGLYALSDQQTMMTMGFRRDD